MRIVQIMMNMLKQSKIPTLLGLFLLLLGVGASVYVVQLQNQPTTNAAADRAPQQVRITNVSDKSFTVSYVTERATVGFIAWGKTTSLGQATDADSQSVIHHLTVSNLSPQTNYYFKIGSDKTIYTNQGKPYSVKTASSLSTVPNNDVVFGTVLTTACTPADAIIYITAAGIEPVSTITNNEGKWSMPLSTARNTNLSSYASYDKATELDITISGGIGKSATAKILAGNAKPVPAIKIGEFKDYTNLTAQNDGSPPNAQLNIPNQNTDQSTFNLSSFNQSSDKIVTLSKPQNQETITTTQPEFSGTGTAKLVFTITIQSNVITDTITVLNNGTWKWIPSTPLELGNHTVTLSWKDSSGQTQSIKRSFRVVQTSAPLVSPSPAGGAVLLSSPLPSPSPSLKPSPSPSPLPSPSPKLSPSPKVSSQAATSSGSILPSSGSLTLTFGIFIMGLVFVFVGILFPNHNKITI